jgi:hypothetical protein
MPQCNHHILEKDFSVIIRFTPLESGHFSQQMKFSTRTIRLVALDAVSAPHNGSLPNLAQCGADASTSLPIPNRSSPVIDNPSSNQTKGFAIHCY